MSQHASGGAELSNQKPTSSSRKSKKPKPKPPSFDDLPDSALIKENELRGQRIVPYSRSTMWRKIKNDEFPAPVKVSAQINAFRVGRVRVWQTDPQGYKLLHIKNGGRK
jgi:prophage regulatory protein